MGHPKRTPLKDVRVGCSGWNYAAWRERFYPPGLPARRWLEAYGGSFETVEVNATFYRLMKPDSVERWLEQVPESFVFAVKASRYLTHVKRLGEIAAGVERFWATIEPLVRAERLGAVLWQLPETFHRDDGRLGHALAKLPAARHAFEFRHPSWFCDEVYALLRAHEAALAIGDHPERPFQSHERTAPWRYVRLHYGKRGRRGNYSRVELETWAQRLHAWRSRDEVFVYFNNDWEAFAPRNARWLERRLAELARGA
jgi:uncharacterized protein YecE (DUF72 family)